MNFLSAIKHAAIDYGIRRKGWSEKSVLTLVNCELFWVNNYVLISETSRPVLLCGPDRTHDLTPEDIAATDWEVI